MLINILVCNVWHNYQWIKQFKYRLDIQYNYDTMFMSGITIFNLLQTCTKLEYVMLMFQMLKTSSMIVSCNKLVCHILHEFLLWILMLFKLHWCLFFLFITYRYFSQFIELTIYIYKIRNQSSSRFKKNHSHELS